MGDSIQTQAYIFLSTLYGGIIIGFIYDLYRIFRYFFRPKKIATFIEDFVFWIIVCIISLYILFSSSWGQIRGYNFIGFLSGALLYNKLLSKYIITFLVHTVRYILKMLNIFLRIVTYPIRLIWRLLSIPRKKIKKKYNRIKRLNKIPLRIYGDLKRNIKMISTKK